MKVLRGWLGKAIVVILCCIGGWIYSLDAKQRSSAEASASVVENMRNLQRLLEVQRQAEQGWPASKPIQIWQVARKGFPSQSEWGVEIRVYKFQVGNHRVCKAVWQMNPSDSRAVVQSLGDVPCDE